MSLILSMIEKEKRKNDYLRTYYKTEIEKLPKGSLVKKKVGNNEYYYLKYRDKNKTVTDYIGKDKKAVTDIEEKLQKRKHYTALLREFNKDNDLINKILEGAK